MPTSGCQPATTRTRLRTVDDVREYIPRPECGDTAPIVVLAVEPFQHRHILVGNLVVAVDLGVGKPGQNFVVARV